MGFNINKEITTKLTWEDLALDEYYKLYNSGMFWEFFSKFKWGLFAR